jgi:hypothetical protein
MRNSRYILVLPLLAVLIFSLPALAISGVSKEKMYPVHQVSLKKERLDIIYGLVDYSCFSLDRVKSQEKYFPYANSVIYGGCVIEPDAPKYKDVLYCEKCREVERNWPCMETPDIQINTTLSPPRVTKLPTLH